MIENPIIMDIYSLVVSIIWLVSAFWLGYIIGKSKVYMDVAKQNTEESEKMMEEIKEILKN